jgi:hypothetical protein
MSPLIQTLVMSVLGPTTLGGLRLALFFVARPVLSKPAVSVNAHEPA